MRTFLLRILITLAVVAAGFSTALSDESVPQKSLFTKHFSHSAFDISPTGLFSIELIPDESEYPIGKNVAGIVIHDAQDSDVVGAELTVIQKDLNTRENVFAGPVDIRDKGNGLYTVSGLDLKRQDNTELSITVKRKGKEDGVKFVLPDALKSPHPKGRYSP